MTMDFSLRPCLAMGKNALFHRWSDWANVRDAIMVGTTSGQIAQTYAIVEYEDGQIDIVHPQSIKFLDNISKNYYWPSHKEAVNGN